MIRVAIVDDEKPARDRIRRMVANHPDLQLAGEAADVDAALRLFETEKPDLVFLDVKMPGGDGFDVLRKAKRLPRIIFTTAFDQYAVKAFEANAIDYLLKPFDRARFDAALGRARETLTARPSDSGQILSLLEQIKAGLPGPSGAAAAGASAGAGTSPASAAGADEPGEPAGDEDTPPPPNPFETLPLSRIAGKRAGKIVLLDPAEVLWFEAEVTIVFARARTGRYLVGKTLADLETQLDPKTFFRCHRRYIVNLSLISEILPTPEEGQYNIVMRDEAKSVVPLSRRQARKLRTLIPW
jgi:DNA-binding LytR/AlgR family response regulator